MDNNMMMMMMSMRGSDNFSVRDDDQLMMIMSSNQQQQQQQQHMFDSMLCPRTENNQPVEVKKQRRRRKPKNMGGDFQNGAVQGKRKLTDHQGAQLELYFESEPKLETERKEKIAAELGLEPRQVAVWFQNRRARWKCKKLEDEFANLRASHHRVLAQNALLEAQVSELSGRLVEAKCDIQRLSGRYESGTPSNGNTPTPSSSSLSMDHAHTGVSEGFGAEDAQMLDNEYVRAMDYYWMNNNNIYDLM